jgi:hypothetical protein
MNIITKITGAVIALTPLGNTIKIQLSGICEQVEHAVNLLYNYHAIDNDHLTWYDKSFSYMELSVTRRSFMRGLLALVYCMETVRNGKHDALARCKRAIVRCAHEFKALLPVERRLDTLQDDMVCA